MIGSMADVKRRPYRSTIRRGDAPALICAAAYRLFSDKGYLGTSIDEIAAEAGVARPTIFTAVGPKATILRLVVDHALAGDDAPVPIAQRVWWREAIEEPDPVHSIQLAARNMCLINQRSAPVLRALETAASVDPEAGEVWGRFQRQRHDGLNEFAVALGRKTAACATTKPPSPTRCGCSPQTPTYDSSATLAGRSSASRPGSPTSFYESCSTDTRCNHVPTPDAIGGCERWAFTWPTRHPRTDTSSLWEAHPTRCRSARGLDAVRWSRRQYSRCRCGAGI